jgi:hypothetical protein
VVKLWTYRKERMVRTIGGSGLIRVFKCKLGNIQVLLGREDAARLGVKPQGIAITFLGTWEVMKKKNDLSWLQD